MSDRFERIFEVLRSRLPNKDDVELLETLIEAHREGGKDAVRSRIEEMIKTLEGGLA